MGKKIGSIERKSRGTSAKSFFFGSFIGFLLCLALIVGAGCFLYFGVSANTVNKTFKTNIDFGSKEANSKTLNDLVKSVVGLSKNTDTYTLNNLKDDFGIEIKDNLFGIDISDLKTVALTDLAEAVEKKFGTISADELRDVNGMNIEDLKKILDKKCVYYYKDKKLYKDSKYETAVKFDYELSADESKVITKGHESSIYLGKVEIELWYLPLSVALADFTANMGSQITLAELETSYGVDLPSYFDNVDRTKTINELETEIKALHLADFLGYKLNGTNVYKDTNKNNKQDAGEEIIGIMAKLAKVQVKDLGDIKANIIDTSTVAEIMGYYKNGDRYYTDKALTQEVTGVMKAAAGKKISELSTIVDELCLIDVFDASAFNSGTLSILKGHENTKVVDMADTLKTVMNDLTINDLHTSGIITLTVTQIDKLDDEIVAGVTLGEMNVMDIVIAYIDSL